MKEIKINQKRVDGTIIVEMWFKSLNQLFDPTDPFPYPEKELTDIAEEAIFGQFIDLSIRKENSLLINIPQGSISPENEEQMAQAVRRHFSFRLDDITREKISSWREGKVSVALAVVNACISISLFHVFFYTAEPSFIFTIVTGIFIIFNWVTVWDTYEYFLYDHRKLRRKYQIYKKLTQTPVTIRQVP